MLFGDDASAASEAPALTPLRVLAPAKVNLFLEIRGKRPDGFHEIATLMLAVDLCDELTLEPTDSGDVTLTADVPDLAISCPTIQPPKAPSIV